MVQQNSGAWLGCRWQRFVCLLFSAALFLIPFSPTSAQTTVGTGSLIGVVNDPTATVVAGANITIVNTATNRVIRTNSNSSGAYASGALSPGQYKVQVSAKGFSSLSELVNVLSSYLTGAPGNIGGTKHALTQNVRIGVGTGVYGLGAPRVAEYTLKLTF